MGKFKRISASLMAIVLVLCVGYFSMMSPTSAWFYDSGVIDSGNNFVFGDVSVNTDFTRKGTVIFDAATKFADPDETDFDSVINIDTITVKNAGTVNARIYANVVNNGSSKGLKWFAYTDEMLVENSVKKTIEKSLNQLTFSALNEYNIGADGNSGHYILIEPGKTIEVKIATWIEYDSVKNQLANGATLNGYDVDITLIASQDVDGAIRR